VPLQRFQAQWSGSTLTGSTYGYYFSIFPGGGQPFVVGDMALTVNIGT
jgi:hypothetical protein